MDSHRDTQETGYTLEAIEQFEAVQRTILLHEELSFLPGLALFIIVGSQMFRGLVSFEQLSGLLRLSAGLTLTASVAIPYVILGMVFNPIVERRKRLLRQTVTRHPETYKALLQLPSEDRFHEDTVLAILKT